MAAARSRHRLLALAWWLALACADGSGPSGRAELAFTALRGDSMRVALASADGGGMRMLGGFGNEATPAWSPDGTRIAFVRFYADLYDTDIYVRDVRTDSIARVTDTPGTGEYNPTWSPDGTRIAFTRYSAASGDVLTVKADGSDEQVVALGTNPAWSRDGRIAYVWPASSGFPAVWVRAGYGADAGQSVQVSPDDGRIYRYPAWARDGRLAFVRVDECCGTEQHSAIVVMRADLTEPREIVADSSALSVPSWSPDGRQIAYTRQRGGDMALWVAAADGSSVRRITRARRSGDAGYGNADPSWRPAP